MIAQFKDAVTQKVKSTARKKYFINGVFLGKNRWLKSFLD